MCASRTLKGLHKGVWVFSLDFLKCITLHFHMGKIQTYTSFNLILSLLNYTITVHAKRYFTFL